MARTRTSDAQRGLFALAADERVVAGVAGGIGRALRVDPTFVRAGFVALTLAGGLGVVLYLVAWWAGGAPARRDDPSDWRPRQAFALGLVVLGLLLFSRDVGLWLGDAFVWPAVLAVTGAAVVWSRTGRSDVAFGGASGAAGVGDVLFEGHRSLARVAVGAVLVAAGGGAILAMNTDFAAAGSVLLAVLLTSAGVAVILGPWLWQLGQQLAAERRERIRSEERAEMAAHLHDSVLQTLAMIQRSGSGREAVALARRQERELRAWLYGAPGGTEAEGVRGALEAMIDRVETAHGVPVEVVVVGDAPVDDQVRAVVNAVGEAAMNAAEHSGASRVDVFVEVEDGVIAAFVRDRGKGFDPSTVPATGGIANSIVGRIERHGGSVTLTSTPGTGTEVAIRAPHAPQAHDRR